MQENIKTNKRNTMKDKIAYNLQNICKISSELCRQNL